MMSKQSSKENVEMRKFGIILGVIFFSIAGYQWKIHERFLAWLVGIGALLLILAFFLPQALRRLYRPWMWGAEKIGNAMNRIILTVFYLLIFTPMALVRRLFHRDPLNLRWHKGKKSYFEPKSTQNIERFENLF